MVAGNEAYPCDDEYENTKTQERRIARTALEVHFNMPREVADLVELEKLGAVLDPPELVN